jgi:glycosyltransferase involved in cell wall biosynthesis
MRLSVIIPAYNAEKYLTRCVESCEKQDMPHNEYEIIIVNDGSVDGTLNVANKLADDYDNIKIFSQENQGTAAARNVGMSKANGDYLWFVDADDYVEINSLAKIYKGILDIDFPDVFIVKIRIESNGENIIKSYNEIDNFESTGRDVVLSGFKPATVCILICKLSFLKTKDLTFKKEIYLEDGEFSLRCMTLANKVFFSDIIAYVYEKHDGSKTVNDSYKAVYNKFWGNIPLVLSWKDFANSLDDEKLKKIIICRSNSTLAGLLVDLKHEKSAVVTKQFKKDFLNKMEQKGCYPVHGPFLSWKMLLYSRLLNIRKFIF